VVQGLITNEAKPFYVRLSQAKLFNSNQQTTYISNAKLTIKKSNNQIFTLTNNGNGYYYLPYDFQSEIGETYTLHIETNDGLIYESDPQKLLPPLSYDSIYGEKTYNRFIGTDGGVRSVNGSSVFVDLFKNVSASSRDSFPTCRFSTSMTLQYEYWVDLPQDSFITIHKFWKTFTPNESENLSEDNSNKSTPFIQHHNIAFVPIEISAYGLSKPADFKEAIYYVKMDQYTINKSTYNFYNEANKQTSAGGKLFDPIITQLQGNIHCTNDKSKIALGFFEVSSVSHSAFRLNHSLNNPNITLTKAPYIGISEGEIHFRQMKKGFPPPGDDNYIDITPIWWYHH
jgi:hypothetical protein